MLGRALVFQYAFDSASLCFDDQRFLVKFPLSRDVRHTPLFAADDPDRFRLLHEFLQFLSPLIAQRDTSKGVYWPRKSLNP